MSVNIAIVQGIVANQPVLDRTRSRHKLRARFTLLSKHRVRTPDANTAPPPTDKARYTTPAYKLVNTYHNVWAFGPMAIYVDKHIRKGDQIVVAGELRKTIPRRSRWKTE